MAAGTRVLVIDDDPDFRESIESLLRSEGYEVAVARSGREGLERLSEERPDLIILDIMMESIVEGYAVSQAIKFQPEYAAFSGIPILMVSSIRESPDERFPWAGELEQVRPDRYLTKPLDIPLFLEVVKQATGRRTAASR
ncbi:MAG: response regulator [Gemmatimonadetes bacterium]|nr:response regulator [Gemmatimonadota bacterium]NIQ57102.1 response regulator [Gemmatimonadota bacterium]NIU77269.1 response regulator [Gammaproteobacteria bacterium]NIX46543.1 response regulator [Gemmatimonadota bacterium]NIY10861.1 response regulator [Gemmatimonadota bacterium]